jgi:tetratricopeptide (TPR) repeat protein
MKSRLEAILDLIEESPDEPMPRMMAGNELLNAGDYEGAIQHLERYIELLPNGDLGAAYRMLGKARAGRGDLDEAREAYERGVAAALAHGHRDLAQAMQQEMAEL